MRLSRWKRLGLWAAALVLLGWAPPTFAQESLEQRVQRLEKHAEKLEKQNEMLLKLLAGQGTSTALAAQPPLGTEEVRQIVGAYLQEKDAQKKAAEVTKKQEGYVVGDDRYLKASWDDGGFRFKTDDNAFSIHMGGRLMTDQVYFNESANLQKSATPPVGSSLPSVSGVGPGIGDLVDGDFVRRARFVADGTIFKTIEFKVEFDFENYNSISFDESYVGVKDLPIIGMVRFGQVHNPFGLEAYTSSRFLPMLGKRTPATWYLRLASRGPGVAG